MESVDENKRLPTTITTGSIALLSVLSAGDTIDKQHKTVG